MNRISILRPKAISSAKALSTAKVLLISASTLAISSVPAQAADVLFSSNGMSAVETGARTSTGAGVLQIRLDSGATLSFVEGAEFTLNDDGSITLHQGSVTVAGAGDVETRIIMPEGVEGRVGGTGNAASFSVTERGDSSGHTLTGTINIARGRRNRDFGEGMMWASAGRNSIRRVLSRPGQQTPDAQRRAEVLDMDAGGPAAAAENGLPVSLGDALAAAGASSDVVAIGRRLDAANGNPALESYPVGDLAALVALAGNLEGAYGGTPFPAAQADIIRTYLGYLANGGSGAEFVTAYAGFLTQYLDLVRAGGLPSQFGGASQADINAFLAYQANLGALGNLAAQDRALATAYLEFIAGGGNADLFAGQFTDLVEAYFAFVRGGGNPSEFTGASQEVIDAYVAFLSESGLAAQLSADNQEILAAYLESGGFAFAETYAAALAGYFSYLQGGGLPSASGDLSPDQLQAYLELLEGSGLFAQLLGDQAQFYADYLAFLQGGGNADDFGQLNANIFAGYASDLNAYFAYLQGGGLPSGFQGDPAVLNAYLAALADAGALDRFLGANAGFFADYLAFLQGGGDIDAFGQLNANIFAGYADALSAYYTYLAQGGLPSQYGDLTQDQIAAYVAALQAQGASDAFLAALSGFYGDYLAYLQGGGDPDVYLGLPSLNIQLFADALDVFGQFLLGGGLPSDFSASDLDTLALYLDALDRAGELGLIGSDADLLAAYFAFLSGGANVDQFAGLPVYADYTAALTAYYDFLLGGGLPADYAALTPQQISDYLAALSSAGGFAAQLGGLSDFYTAYFAHLAGGNDPATFSGLPVYADYVSALNAYYAFLAGGGLPGDYTGLPLATLEAYLDALTAAGGFAAYGDLNAFFASYYAFVSGGGDPANFTDLPVYADYVAALNAYFTFLAGGGVPSDYTGLPLATLQAYLDALAAAGGFAAYGDLNAFFADYYAFVSGGGVPDDFGGLPGAGGGITIPDAGYAYAGGFTATTGINGYVASTGLTGWQSNIDGSIDANGVPSGFAFLPDGETPVNIGGDARGVVGQFADANMHYVLLAPLVGNLPTSGTIDYEVIAATAPTYSDNHTDAGTFAASLTFGFGASLTYGIDGTITMPDATYSFASPGRSNDQLVALTTFVNANFVGMRPDLSGNGPACAGSNCFLNIFGGFGTDSPGDVFGFSYHSAGSSAGGSPFVQGSALFGAAGGNGGGAATEVFAGTDPRFNLTYNGGFTGAGAGFNNYGGYTNGGLSNLGAPSINTGPNNNFGATVSDAGGVLSYGALPDTTSLVEAETASIRDVYGNANALIGRFTEGSLRISTTTLDLSENQGVHYLLRQPMGGAITLPAGTIGYELIAATQPTLASGATAPGTFEASIAIAFGATPMGGMEGSITMPGAGGFTFDFATDGGTANPSSALSFIGSSGNVDFFGQGTHSGGSALDGTFIFNGTLLDAAADQIGGTFQATFGTGFDSDNITAAAIFGSTGPVDNGGGMGGGGTTSDFTGTRDSIVYYNFTNGSLASGFGGSATLANGQLTGMTSLLGTISNNTTSIVEAGDIGDLAWARWTNGSVNDNGLFGNVDIPVDANGGYHVMAGAASTSLPASGKVDYDLIATTSPTDNQGSAPGTLTGALAIQYGGASTVGYQFQMDVGGNGWGVSTTGGAANPGASEIVLESANSAGPIFGGTFSSTAGSVAGTGGACSSTCLVTISGALYGNNGAHAGVAVNVTDASATGVITATGLAIFSSTVEASGSAPASTAASAAPQLAAVADWDRWEVGGENISSGNGMAMAAPGMDALMASGVQYSPEQLAQLEAFYASRNPVN